MGSTRLPGKSLLPLAGVPLVGRILERVKKSKLLDEVILAIPESSENDVLANLGNLYQIIMIPSNCLKQHFNLIHFYMQYFLSH
jgi:spore coat polysaccharide biosynthesis protein SpsF (cytidylyltransferase family)